MTGESPEPKVVYLPALFRAIKAGEIRVPAFQRGFVWKSPQVLELLESVYRSYPIGSLLFWHVDASVMRSAHGVDVPLPHPEVTGKVDFVLDGMQRISTLYGAFNARELPAGEEDVFATVFDVSTERFLAYRDRTETSIDLRKLFTPRLLLEEQARLGALPDGDALVERTLELQRRFQEYLVPVVRIGSPDSSEVVRIFERINTTGTTLSAVDFMRALTWSHDFDLNEVLEDLAITAADDGFAVSADTLAKCVALEAGVLPVANEMVRLRDKEPAELHQAVKRTRVALLRGLQYFRDVGVKSTDYIPYEGQFLVFVSAAASSRSTEHAPEWLRRWYWAVGYSEALQGRPDHYIARLAREARENAETGIKERLSLTLDALKVRPMRKGAALPVTFVAGLATRTLYSAISGKIIDPESVLAAYENSMIAPVYNRTELGELIGTSTRTDKVVANTVVLAPEERGRRLAHRDLRAAILRLAESGGADKLESQCINGECLAALQEDDVARFLEARAAAIHALACNLAGATPSS